MVGSRSRESGYVALLAVLIVGAAATAIALALLLAGTDSQRSELIALQAKQARSLATACGQEAMQQLRDNVAYSSSGSLNIGAGSCTYSVSQSTTTSRVITVTGTVGTVLKKLTATATIGATTNTISSWKEVATNGPSTPAFVQVVSSIPQTAQTSTSATYATQTAGNLNVVILGWDNITSTVSSVVDNAGNTYLPAAPIIRSSGNSQAMYYAKNITGGAPTVTVTMSASTAFIDLRIVEYSGIDTVSPLDTSASGIGVAGTASSGTLNTSYPAELIVSGGTTKNGFQTAGSGYTLRTINGDGDIVQDRVTTTMGPYAATAAVSGVYVLQAAAFRAAGQ